MRITVAICTWNRAALLDRALGSLAGLHIPQGIEWEVIVVNNNSTDDTEAVVQRHAARLPLRLLGEPKQGKSYALNTALAAARGEVTLWTDDDVLADRAWLAEYAALACRHPGDAFWGGPVEPVFESPVPAWVWEAWPHIKAAFAACDYGRQALDLNRERLAFGANFAIRTQVQRRFPYDPRLGRVGPGQVRGEETDVQIRMLAAGLRGRWAPSARISHIVERDRVSLGYLQAFFHGIGRSEALLKNDVGRHPVSLWVRRLGMRWRLAGNRVKWSLARVFTDSARQVEYLSKVHYLRGRLAHAANARQQESR